MLYIRVNLTKNMKTTFFGSKLTWTFGIAGGLLTFIPISPGVTLLGALSTLFLGLSFDPPLYGKIIFYLLAVIINFFFLGLFGFLLDLSLRSKRSLLYVFLLLISFSVIIFGAFIMLLVVLDKSGFQY